MAQSYPVQSFMTPDPSAIAAIIKQQQMEEDLRAKEQANALQEIVLDQLRGYGTPGQRSEQMGGGPGLATAISQGANNFSNINPEGGYSTGRGTPSEMIPGMRDIQPAGGGLRDELSRKAMGLSAQSPEQMRDEKIMLQFLQNFLRQGTEKRKVEGQKEVAEFSSKLPAKQPIAAATPEGEILSAIASGKSLTPGQQKAWDMLHPVERDALGLTKLVLQNSTEYMLADPRARVKMELEALNEVRSKLSAGRSGNAPAATPAPEEGTKKRITHAAWAQMVKKQGSVAKAKLQAESQGYDLSRYAD